MNLIFINTAVDQTDDRLVAQMKAVIELRESHQYDAVLSVMGYDDDRRELWQIDEVRAHLRRLVDFGAIAVLVRSLMVRELVPRDLIGCPALGAFEVWAHGHELLQAGPKTCPSRS